MYRFMVTLMLKFDDLYKIDVAVYDHQSLKGFSNYLQMGYNIGSDFKLSEIIMEIAFSFAFKGTYMSSIPLQHSQEKSILGLTLLKTIVVLILRLS